MNRSTLAPEDFHFSAEKRTAPAVGSSLPERLEAQFPFFGNLTIRSYISGTPDSAESMLTVKGTYLDKENGSATPKPVSTNYLFACQDDLLQATHNKAFMASAFWEMAAQLPESLRAKLQQFAAPNLPGMRDAHGNKQMEKKVFHLASGMSCRLFGATRLDHA